MDTIKMDSIQPINWEHDLVSYLIENYKTNQLLYRTDLPEYKDQTKRQKVIKEIHGNILQKFPEISHQGLTPDDVRKKIQSVRTQYIKEVRKIERSIASGATGNKIFKSKWWCFDKLTFLTEQNAYNVSAGNSMRYECIPEVLTDPLDIETYTITPSERCRVCLMQSGCVLSLEDQILIEENSMSLSELLVMFTNIQVAPDDEKPQTMCITCANEVRNMYKFKLTCERSDKILNNELLSLLAVDELQLAYIHEMKEEIFIEEMNVEETSVEEKTQNIEVKQNIEQQNIEEDAENAKTNIEKVEIIDNYKTEEKMIIIDGEKLSDSEWKCTKCNKIFNKLMNLQRHLRRGHKNMLNSIKCCYCDFVAETHIKLAKHKYLEHDDKKTLKCNICGKKFFKKVNLRLHMVIHSGEKRHTCEYCGRAFTLYCNLKTHLRLHTGEKPYLCLTCGKTFVQSSSLHAHQIGHTETKDEVCSKCGKLFKRKGTLRIHMKTHLEESKREYKCTLCGVVLMAQGSLRRHMMTHTGLCKFECKECGKKFNRNSNLRVHMMIHTGETPYVCDVCGKGFIQAHCLRNHLVIHGKK